MGLANKWTEWTPLRRERLARFLNAEQRDPRLDETRYPLFDVERAQQLIDEYEIGTCYVPQGGWAGAAGA
jgi:phosphatidylinositol phospholipase C, beta